MSIWSAKFFLGLFLGLFLGFFLGLFWYGMQLIAKHKIIPFYFNPLQFRVLFVIIKLYNKNISIPVACIIYQI